MNQASIGTAVSEFQMRAAAAATHGLITGTFFDICKFKSIAVVLRLEGTLAGPDYDALRALHCVHYVDMGDRLSADVKKKVLEWFGMAQAGNGCTPALPVLDAPANGGGS